MPYSGYRRLGIVFGAYTRLDRLRSRMKQVRQRPRYMATGAKVAPSLDSDAVLLPLDVLRVPPSEPSRADPVRLSLGYVKSESDHELASNRKWYTASSSSCGLMGPQTHSPSAPSRFSCPGAAPPDGADGSESPDVTNGRDG